MKKIPCKLKIVYLMKNGEEISYGDLTDITEGLQKSKPIIVNGKKRYKKIHYEQSFYEMWQHTTTDKIVEELNKLLPRVCIRQKTMYYFTKEEIVKVKL